MYNNYTGDVHVPSGDEQVVFSNYSMGNVEVSTVPGEYITDSLPTVPPGESDQLFQPAPPVSTTSPIRAYRGRKKVVVIPRELDMTIHAFSQDEVSVARKGEGRSEVEEGRSEVEGRREDVGRVEEEGRNEVEDMSAQKGMGSVAESDANLVQEEEGVANITESVSHIAEGVAHIEVSAGYTEDDLGCEMEALSVTESDKGDAMSAEVDIPKATSDEDGLPRAEDISVAELGVPGAEGSGHDALVTASDAEGGPPVVESGPLETEGEIESGPPEDEIGPPVAESGPPETEGEIESGPPEDEIGPPVAESGPPETEGEIESGPPEDEIGPPVAESGAEVGPPEARSEVVGRAENTELVAPRARRGAVKKVVVIPREQDSVLQLFSQEEVTRSKKKVSPQTAETPIHPPLPPEPPLPIWPPLPPELPRPPEPPLPLQQPLPPGEPAQPAPPIAPLCPLDQSRPPSSSTQQPLPSDQPADQPLPPAQLSPPIQQPRPPVQQPPEVAEIQETERVTMSEGISTQGSTQSPHRSSKSLFSSYEESTNHGDPLPNVPPQKSHSLQVPSSPSTSRSPLRTSADSAPSLSPAPARLQRNGEVFAVSDFKMSLHAPPPDDFLYQTDSEAVCSESEMRLESPTPGPPNEGAGPHMVQVEEAGPLEVEETESGFEVAGPVVDSCDEEAGPRVQGAGPEIKGSEEEESEEEIELEYPVTSMIVKPPTRHAAAASLPAVSTQPHPLEPPMATTTVVTSSTTVLTSSPAVDLARPHPSDTPTATVVTTSPAADLSKDMPMDKTTMVTTSPAADLSKDMPMDKTTMVTTSPAVDLSPLVLPYPLPVSLPPMLRTSSSLRQLISLAAWGKGNNHLNHKERPTSTPDIAGTITPVLTEEAGREGGAPSSQEILIPSPPPSRTSEEERREVSRTSEEERRETSRTSEEERREVGRTSEEERREVGRTSEEERREVGRTSEEERREAGRTSEEERREASRTSESERGGVGRASEEIAPSTRTSERERGRISEGDREGEDVVMVSDSEETSTGRDVVCVAEERSSVVVKGSERSGVEKGRRKEERSRTKKGGSRMEEKRSGTEKEGSGIEKQTSGMEKGGGGMEDVMVVAKDRADIHW